MSRLDVMKGEVVPAYSMKVFGGLVVYQSRHYKDVSSVTPSLRHYQGKKGQT